MYRLHGGPDASRIAAVCTDYSIRLLSPLNGTTITTVPPEIKLGTNAIRARSVLESLAARTQALVSAEFTVASIVSCASMRRLFCLMNDGSVKVYGITTNPCRLLNTWKSTGPHEHRTVALYMAEYVFNVEDNVHALSRWMNLVGRVISGNRLLVLFGATANGRIVRYDVELGRKTLEVQGASSAKVSVVMMMSMAH